MPLGMARVGREAAGRGQEMVTSQPEPRGAGVQKAGLTCATWMNLSSTCARCAGPGRLSTMTCTQRDTLLLRPTEPSRVGQPRTEPCKT